VLFIPIFIYLILQPSRASHIAAFALFVVASLTDLIDGYLARRLNQETEFGKFLDPLADKFLVLAAFITFIFLSEQIQIWMVLCIAGRDVFITCLRYLAVYQGKSLRTSRLAKVKTAFQMFSIIAILLSFMFLTVGERFLINRDYHDAVAAGVSRWDVAAENFFRFLSGGYDNFLYGLATFLPYYLMMLTTWITIISFVRYLITNHQLFLGPIPVIRPRQVENHAPAAVNLESNSPPDQERSSMPNA
jgi:cardiolipin synthase